MLEQYGDVLSIGELQQILGIGRNMAYTLLHTGQITAFLVGQKKWRISKASVLRYIAQNG